MPSSELLNNINTLTYVLNAHDFSFIQIFSIKDIIFQIRNKCTNFSYVLLHHGMKNGQLLPLLCQLLSLSLSFFQCFESMLGRFKAPRNLFTAASPIPENKIAIKM